MRMKKISVYKTLRISPVDRPVYVCVRVPVKEKWMWVHPGRDIDPGELAKVRKERSIFQRRAETNGPRRYRSTHVTVPQVVGDARATRRAKLKKHASQKPRGVHRLLAFCETPPLYGLLPLSSASGQLASFAERAAAWDAHYRNCFTRRLRSTYICYCCGHHYRNCWRTVHLKFGSRMFAIRLPSIT